MFSNDNKTKIESNSPAEGVVTSAPRAKENDARGHWFVIKHGGLLAKQEDSLILWR